MNSRNVCIFLGYLLRDNNYNVNAEGKKWQAQNVLCVNRAYKKDDAIPKDFVPIKISGEARMEMAEKYQKGDYVQVIGEYRTGRYKDKATGEEIYTTHIEVNEISWAPRVQVQGEASSGSSASENKGTNNSATPAPSPTPTTTVVENTSNTPVNDVEDDGGFTPLSEEDDPFKLPFGD